MLGVRESLAESIIRIWRDNDDIKGEFKKFSTFAAFMECGPEKDRDTIIAENPPRHKVKHGSKPVNHEAEWEREFLQSEKLQAAYGSLKTYLAFKSAEQAGKVKSAGKKVIS